MIAALASTLLLLAGQGEFPPLLSQLAAYDVAQQQPRGGFVAYEINHPFWAGDSAKERWFKLPPGSQILVSSEENWSLPAGTILVKNFRNGTRGDRELIETRVLKVLGNNRVAGASYRWNPDTHDAQIVNDATEATLSDEKKWFLPGRKDCATCHNQASGGALGLNTRQMNREIAGENQLLALRRAGLFANPEAIASPDELPRLATLGDETAELLHRVRSYLDANCSFCHRPGVAAGNFDARFSIPFEKQNLLGPVLIDLNIDGARLIAPKDPWRSILFQRLATLEGTKMPPLGHLQIDREGVALLRAWIDSLPGEKAVAPPVIRSEDRGGTVLARLQNVPGAQIRYTTEKVRRIKNRCSTKSLSQWKNRRSSGRAPTKRE